MLLLSIAYNISAKKVQKNYPSWHWKVIQTLRKNWLFVWKVTSEIWWILMQAVGSLKICTLMGYFCRKYVIFQVHTEELRHGKWLIISKIICICFRWRNVFFGQKQPIELQLFGLSTACLKLSKFLMWFLKSGVSFCIKFAQFCNILAKT